MWSLIVYEVRLRRRAVVGWIAILFVYLGLIAWAWRAGRGELRQLYEEIIRHYPEEFIKFFAKGVPQVLTAEAFYALEYFTFMYVLVFAAFMAYLGAGIVVDDVLDKLGSISLTLPVSRRGLLVARFLALIAVASLVTLASITLTLTLYSAAGVGGDLDYEKIAVLHLHGLVYIAACAALGTLAGAVLPFHLAKPTAAGLVVVSYAIDTLTLDTSLEPLGYLTLPRYMPVLEIASEGSIALGDALTLLASTAILLGLALLFYEKRDIPA